MSLDRLVAWIAAARNVSAEEVHELLRQFALTVKEMLNPVSAGEHMGRLFELIERTAEGDVEIAKLLSTRANITLDEAAQYSREIATALLVDAVREASAFSRPAISITFTLQEARQWKSDAEMVAEQVKRPKAPERPDPMLAPPALAPPAAFDRYNVSGQGMRLNEPGPCEYRVWFGTNRELVDEAQPSAGFSGNRARQIRYGHCDVYVPKSHKIGSIGSSRLIRMLSRTDDRLKLLQLSCLRPDDFWVKIGDQLARAPAGRRHAVVFIHGYNVSFESAAIRAAQLGFDLGIDGAMAFFSWPSRGTVDDYPTDGASIEASEPAITEFLIDFAERSGAEAVHVIAHSMGNRGLLRAVTRVAHYAERRSALRFANFILAAPDVDVDTFQHLAAAYGAIARRTTLYVSERDRALALSHWLHDYPRVGFAPPVTVFEGIDTINVTNIDLTMLGHGYVGEAREVLVDMHSIIYQGLPPERRFSLRPAETTDGKRYWNVSA